MISRGVMMYINFLKSNYIIIAFSIIITLCLYLINVNINMKVDCTSTFYNVPDDPSWQYLSGTMSVTLDDNTVGQVMFSGKAKNLEKMNRFERLITFKYHKGSENNYHLTDVNVTKYAEDDLNDDVFKKYIYAPTLEKNDHLVIFNIRNGYLIGSMIGPRHLCVRR